MTGAAFAVAIALVVLAISAVGGYVVWCWAQWEQEQRDRWQRYSKRR